MSECIEREKVVELLNKWSGGYSYIEVPTKDAIACVRAIPAFVEELKRKNPPIQRKPKTNAERIRELTDEEISEFTIGVVDGVFELFTGAKMPDEKRREMKTAWLDWLNQEAD